MGNHSGLDYDTLIAWAAGTVAAQADCTLNEAVALMLERAMQTHHTLEEIADGVIDRTIRFYP